MRPTPPAARPAVTRVAARATVPRDDLRVAERVEALAGLGFHEVGVSPLRTGPDPSLALRDGDWPDFLAAMTRAADTDIIRAAVDGPLRFSNLAIALKELHRGASRPLPCGGGCHAEVIAAGRAGCDYVRG